MRIKSVSYRETRTFGSYQNVTIEMSADVTEDTTSGHVCDELKSHVQVQLAKRIEERTIECNERYAREDKSRELIRVEDNITEATARYERIKAFLAKFGVTELEEIPF